MMERLGGVSSIRALASVKYMLEVGSAILIAAFMKEEINATNRVMASFIFICNWLFLYIIRGINKNIFLLKML